ncbi:MAG: shikimate kinase [Oscillospiraceae bacterium]|nr:shikimate kinase [Oscillospiraceae bacterium]
MKCGLLGEKLGHSYSPSIHRELGDYSYALFEVAPPDLEGFLKHGDFHGLNVTIPYKKAVMAYCSELSETARAMGCVNTLIRRMDGSLYGDNTDAYGFTWLLDRNGGIRPGEKALILGTGGAAGTVRRVLESRGAQTVLVSRQGENNYVNLYEHRDAVLLVNATPVGMYPNNSERLVDLSRLPKLRCVLDLIYNPCRTKLLMDAEALGLTWENGLSMLVAQAVRAGELFTGNSIDRAKQEKILCKLKKEMENLILIGMPGSGKTAAGRALAQRLGRPFADADEELAKEIGDIPTFFANYGEDAFRKEETKVLSRLCKASGFVIATGGGCVTREENYPILHLNGRIIRIQRPLCLLATEGRPLSQGANLQTLFAKRDPLYTRFADSCVENIDTLQGVVERILEIL